MRDAEAEPHQAAQQKASAPPGVDVRALSVDTRPQASDRGQSAVSKETMQR